MNIYDYEINIDSLNLLPRMQDKIIYFRWYKCPDCLLFEQEVLSKIVDKLDSFYVVEVDDYRVLKDDDNTKHLWEKFVKDYKLDFYHNGRIPSILFYQGSFLIDRFVYLNDIIEDGKIVSSFYKDCPYINKEISSREEYYALAASFHTKKAIDIFTKYIG